MIGLFNAICQCYGGTDLQRKLAESERQRRQCGNDRPLQHQPERSSSRHQTLRADERHAPSKTTRFTSGKMRTWIWCSTQIGPAGPTTLMYNNIFNVEGSAKFGYGVTGTTVRMSAHRVWVKAPTTSMTITSIMELNQPRTLTRSRTTPCC